jgi:hypothetical protein
MRDAPIREPIQPMPPVWSMWFQSMVKEINGKQNSVAGFTGTITAAELATKTITVENGIITGFA